jgi:hypothetical protein
MHDPYLDPSSPFAAKVYPPPTSPLAITSFVMGILGWTVLFGLGAILAVITGHMALSEIRTANGRVGGTPFAVIGLVLGYVFFALALVIILIVVAVIVLGFQFAAHPRPRMQALAIPVRLVARLGREETTCIRYVPRATTQASRLRIDNVAISNSMSHLCSEARTVKTRDQAGNIRGLRHGTGLVRNRNERKDRKPTASDASCRVSRAPGRSRAEIPV